MSNAPPEYYVMAALFMAVIMGAAMLTFIALHHISEYRAAKMAQEVGDGEANPKKKTSEETEKTTD